LLLVSSLPLSGCSMVIGKVTSGMADNLSAAVLNQDDAGLVRDGEPAYLIMIDGLIEGDRGYGHRAMCLRKEGICEAAGGDFDGFVAALQSADEDDLPVLYGWGSAWASWIQADSADWNAIADLPKVQALMERIVALESGYEEGGAHLYLGVLYTLRPASMGGQPELGRDHFEKAIEYSGGRNLLAKTLFASQYAKLVFDKELHDQLLTEVVEAEAAQPGYTLSNTMAQETAQELLAESDEYF